MAAGGHARGEMDIHDQRETFHGFLVVSIWGGGLIAQALALLTLAFAINLGWWPGLFSFIAIGVAIGLFFRVSGVYWAAQVALWVMLGLGGFLVPALAGLMG